MSPTPVSTLRDDRWRRALLSRRRWLPGSTSAGLCFAVAAVMVITAVVVAAVTVRTIFQLRVTLPVWDEWAWVDDFRLVWEGTYPWTELVRPHNEHRILFPRLVFLADSSLFAMDGRPVLVVNLLLQAANVALLVRLMARSLAAPVLRLLLGALAITVLFSLRQSENLANVFQVQFIGVFTAALVAVTGYVAALERRAAGNRGSTPGFCLAAVGCVVSAYTMVNGILAGLVLVPLALLLRAPWRTAGATLALWGLLAACFFHGYQPLGATQPLPQVHSHPAAYRAYLLAYLGNPFSTAVSWAQAFGLVGLGAFAAACCAAARRPSPPSAAGLIGIAGFMLATACATAYGRVDLGAAQALERRYVTPSALFWCALILFWASWIARRRAGTARALAGAMLTLVAASLVVSSVRFELAARPDMAAQAAKFRQFRDSLLTALYDPTVTARYEVWPDDEIRGSSDFLRTARLSLFSEPRAAALGRPIAGLGSVTAPDACSGSVAAAQASPDLGRDGVRLRGFAFDREHGRDAQDILLTDRDGIVVGYGSVDRPLGLPREWIGYARLAPGAEIQAFTPVGAGRLCRLGSATVASR